MESGKEFLIVRPTSSEQQAAQNRKYFLFEFPENVHKHLEEDGRVFIAAGAPNDDAILRVTYEEKKEKEDDGTDNVVTKEEKFLLKVCDTSNTLFVAPEPTPAANGNDGSGKLNVMKFENYIECLQHVK